MPQTTPNDIKPHNEPKPHSGTIGEAAQAVAAYCLLPDPRSGGKQFTDFATSFWRGWHWESKQDCAKDEIVGKPGGSSLYANKATHDHIMQHAREFAAAGMQLCQVRDFHDITVVKHPYYGYRGADAQCHVTQNPQEALTARKHYKQTR